MRRLYFTFAAAVSAIALVGVTQEAQAGALGAGTTQISAFTMTTTVPVTVDSESSSQSATAALNGIPAVSTTPATAPNANQVCLGSCAAFTPAGTPQSFTLVEPTLGATTTPFAQSATNAAGSVIAPGGASSNTESQTQLLGSNTGQGNAANGLTAGVTLTLVGPPGSSADVTGTFNALISLLAQTDATGATGLASGSFEIKFIDATTSAVLFDWSPDGTDGGTTCTVACTVSDMGVNLNNQVSADFPNLNIPYLATGTGLTFTALLPEDVPLDFSISQTNVVQATSVPTTVVPEPMSLALFGAGLLGFGAMSRMRRRRA